MDEVEIGVDMRGNRRATGARDGRCALFTTYRDILAVGRRV